LAPIRSIRALTLLTTSGSASIYITQCWENRALYKLSLSLFVAPILLLRQARDLIIIWARRFTFLTNGSKGASSDVPAHQSILTLLARRSCSRLRSIISSTGLTEELVIFAGDKISNIYYRLLTGIRIALIPSFQEGLAVKC